MTETERTASHPRRIVFVSHRRKAFEGVPGSIVCAGRAACVELFDQAAGTTWVSLDSSLLVRAIESWLPRVRSSRRLGHLLLLEQPEHSRVPVLRSLFDRVTGDGPSFEFLPIDEMLEVLSVPPDEARDLIIGGNVDHQMEAVVLVRGDLRSLVVPFSAFKPSGEVVPDFYGLAITDSGQSVKFGEHEAAADVILYRADADYRRRLNSSRRAAERGFGPALRRLRKQLGIARTDFPGLSSKTIARIERRETIPRQRTRKMIEEHLGMSSEQIETY